MNYNEGTADNGNLAVWNASAVSNFNRAYTYDSLNRLSTMTDSYTGATCGGASWTYDAWSNRLDQTATKGSCLAPQFTFNTNNQIISPTGFTYDAAGNTTHDASHSYTFDAENRITAVDSGTTATYSYDALGRRVEKIVAGVTTDYLYNLSDAVAAEQAKGFTWGPGYVYLNGALIAQYGNSTTYFVHHDHLGTTRLMTNVNGTVYDSMDYMPFGEQIAGGSGTNHKFTGKERDIESGNDYFGARYYASAMGRWMSPDWSAKAEPVPYSKLTDPQTLNLYSYVGNNPLSRFDDDGHEVITVQLRAYIPQANVGPYVGDNRGPTASQNVTSRTSITLSVETDPSISANPLIGTPVSTAGQTENLLTGNTATQTVGLPTATVTRDSSGNVVINVTQDAANPLTPSGVTPGIQSNLNITVPTSGSSVTAAGTVSGSPAFEMNVTPAGGTTTNVPLQGASSNPAAFAAGLTQTNSILKSTPLPPPPPACGSVAGAPCH
jgi:RHS repeat-associated protein